MPFKFNSPSPHTDTLPRPPLCTHTTRGLSGWPASNRVYLLSTEFNMKITVIMGGEGMLIVIYSVQPADRPAGCPVDLEASIPTRVDWIDQNYNQSSWIIGIAINNPRVVRVKVRLGNIYYIIGNKQDTHPYTTNTRTHALDIYDAINACKRRHMLKSLTNQMTSLETSHNEYGMFVRHSHDPPPIFVPSSAIPMTRLVVGRAIRGWPVSLRQYLAHPATKLNH